MFVEEFRDWMKVEWLVLVHVLADIYVSDSMTRETVYYQQRWGALEEEQF